MVVYVCCSCTLSDVRCRVLIWLRIYEEKLTVRACLSCLCQQIEYHADTCVLLIVNVVIQNTSPLWYACKAAKCGGGRDNGEVYMPLRTNPLTMYVLYYPLSLLPFNRSSSIQYANIFLCSCQCVHCETQYPDKCSALLYYSI